MSPYWHVPGAHAWHAYSFESRSGLVWEALCGRRVYSGAKADLRDAVPDDGHLCGNCSRRIAANAKRADRIRASAIIPQAFMQAIADDARTPNPYRGLVS